VQAFDFGEKELNKYIKMQKALGFVIGYGLAGEIIVNSKTNLAGKRT